MPSFSRYLVAFDWISIKANILFENVGHKIYLALKWKEYLTLHLVRADHYGYDFDILLFVGRFTLIIYE